MRLITHYDIAASERIRQIYLTKKDDLELNQRKLADRMKVKQPFISQVMNGKVAINLNTVLEFASILKVRPEELDPNYERRFPHAAAHQSIVTSIDTLTTVGKIRHNAPYTTSDPQPLQDRYREDLLVFSLDADTVPWVSDNASVVVSLRSRTYKRNQPVLVETRQKDKWVYTVRRVAETGAEHFETDPPKTNKDFTYPVVAIRY